MSLGKKKEALEKLILILFNFQIFYNLIFNLATMKILLFSQIM